MRVLVWVKSEVILFYILAHNFVPSNLKGHESDKG